MSVLVVSTRAALGQLTAAQAATYGKMGVLSSTIAEAWYWDASSTAAADTSTVIMPADSPATGRILACDTDYEGVALLLTALKDGTAEISSSVSQTSSALDVLTGSIVDALAYLTDTSTFAELEELVALQALEQNFTSYTLYKQSTTAMYASLSKATASIKQVSTVAVSAKEAVADITTTVQANYAETVALVTQEVQARANADLSLSTTLTSLTSTVSGNTALITQEAQTRASADSALSTTLNSLSSAYQSADTSLSGQIATNTATITQEAQTRASADSAISDSLTKVTATVGNISASGYMRSWTVASSEGASATVGFGAVASSGATSATAALLLHAESNGTTWAAVKVGHFFFMNSNDEVVAWFDDSGNLNLAGMLTAGAISNSVSINTIGTALTAAAVDMTDSWSGVLSSGGVTIKAGSSNYYKIYEFERSDSSYTVLISLAIFGEAVFDSYSSAAAIAAVATGGDLHVFMQASTDNSSWINIGYCPLTAMMKLLYSGTSSEQVSTTASSNTLIGIAGAGYKYIRICAMASGTNFWIGFLSGYYQTAKY